MSSEVISLDEAKKVAVEYVRKEEQLGDVEVNEELSSIIIGEYLVYTMRGKVRKHYPPKLDVTTNVYIGSESAERCFKLQIIANKIFSNEDRIVIYLPSDWIKKDDEDLKSDREMKKSQLERNAVDFEYLERMIKKDKQQQGHYINKRLIRELGIDIKELGLDLDDLYL